MSAKNSPSFSPQKNSIYVTDNFSFFSHGKCGDFFIYDQSQVPSSNSCNNSLQILMDSIHFCFPRYSFEDRSFPVAPNLFCAKFMLNNITLCQVTDELPAESVKEQAAKLLLEALEKEFYTIKVRKKMRNNQLVITRESLKESSWLLDSPENLVVKKANAVAIPGHTCLKDVSAMRMSLAVAFSHLVDQAFEDYVNSEVTCDLMFSEFSRKELSKIKRCYKYLKRNKTLGHYITLKEESESYLKFSRIFEPNQLFSILVKSVGIRGKYTLIPPTCSVKKW